MQAMNILESFIALLSKTILNGSGRTDSWTQQFSILLQIMIIFKNFDQGNYVSGRDFDFNSWSTEINSSYMKYKLSAILFQLKINEPLESI